MLVDFEINSRKKILWVSHSNMYVWGGDIIGYRNINTNKILSKSQYEQMIEREIKERWQNMDIDELTDYEDAENLWANILNSVETDFEPLVEVILSDYNDIDYDDLEMYEPYVEMHWLDVLAIEHNKSIYEIAEKGNIPESTLYNIISKKIQLDDISTETFNAILKGLGISILEFIYKYDGRLF